jgi:hypothetical protein
VWCVGVFKAAASASLAILTPNGCLQGMQTRSASKQGCSLCFFPFFAAAPSTLLESKRHDVPARLQNTQTRLGCEQGKKRHLEEKSAENERCAVFENRLMDFGVTWSHCLNLSYGA